MDMGHFESPPRTLTQEGNLRVAVTGMAQGGLVVNDSPKCAG